MAPINARFVAPEARFLLENSGAAALAWTPEVAGVEVVGVVGLPHERWAKP